MIHRFSWRAMASCIALAMYFSAERARAGDDGGEAQVPEEDECPVDGPASRTPSDWRLKAAAEELLRRDGGSVVSAYGCLRRMRHPAPALCERVARAFAADSSLEDVSGWIKVAIAKCLDASTAPKLRAHLQVVEGSLRNDAEPIARALLLHSSAEALAELARVRPPRVQVQRFASRERALERLSVDRLAVQTQGGEWLVVPSRDDAGGPTYTPIAGWWWNDALVIEADDRGEGTYAHGSTSETRHWVLRRAALLDDDRFEAWEVVLDLQTGGAATGRATMSVDTPKCEEFRVVRPTRDALEITAQRAATGVPRCSVLGWPRLFPAGRILRSWVEAIGAKQLQ